MKEIFEKYEASKIRLDNTWFVNIISLVLVLIFRMQAAHWRSASTYVCVLVTVVLELPTCVPIYVCLAFVSTARSSRPRIVPQVPNPHHLSINEGLTAGFMQTLKHITMELE